MLNVVQGHSEETISLVCTKTLTAILAITLSTTSEQFLGVGRKYFNMFIAQELRAPQCLDHSPALLVELSVVILLKYVCLLWLLRVIQLPQQDNSI